MPRRARWPDPYRSKLPYWREGGGFTNYSRFDSALVSTSQKAEIVRVVGVVVCGGRLFKGCIFGLLQGSFLRGLVGFVV